MKAVMHYVDTELEAAPKRKTALAPSVSSLFRKAVRKAEEPNRVAGAWAPGVRTRSRRLRSRSRCRRAPGEGTSKTEP